MSNSCTQLESSGHKGPCFLLIYPLYNNNKLISGWSLDKFEKHIGPLFPTPDQLGVPPITVRLGQSVEGGGKRRIFAIGN